MQSTGQTSTHDLSFRLMHGSAMMYGIQAPGIHVAPAARLGPNRKLRAGLPPVQGPVTGAAIRVIRDNTPTSSVYCARAMGSGSSAARLNAAAAPPPHPSSTRDP